MPDVTKLLNSHLASRFTLTQQFSEEEVEHWCVICVTRLLHVGGSQQHQSQSGTGKGTYTKHLLKRH